MNVLLNGIGGNSKSSNGGVLIAQYDIDSTKTRAAHNTAFWSDISFVNIKSNAFPDETSGIWRISYSCNFTGVVTPSGSLYQNGDMKTYAMLYRPPTTNSSNPTILDQKAGPLQYQSSSTGSAFSIDIEFIGDSILEYGHSSFFFNPYNGFSDSIQNQNIYRTGAVDVGFTIHINSTRTGNCDITCKGTVEIHKIA